VLTDVGPVDEAEEVEETDGRHDHEINLVAEATLGAPVVGELGGGISATRGQLASIGT
jgi:hypothetical protein